MNQAERMNSATNAWEADPWDASDEVADAQLADFQTLSLEPVVWKSIRKVGPSIFGRDIQAFLDADVEFCAIHDGRDMLLMQQDWHGFPDPPEWRLASRPSGQPDQQWRSLGYFADLPRGWIMPEGYRE